MSEIKSALELWQWLVDNCDMHTDLLIMLILILVMVIAWLVKLRHENQQERICTQKGVVHVEGATIKANGPVTYAPILVAHETNTSAARQFPINNLPPQERQWALTTIKQRRELAEIAKETTLHDDTGNDSFITTDGYPRLIAFHASAHMYDEEDLHGKGYFKVNGWTHYLISQSTPHGDFAILKEGKEAQAIYDSLLAELGRDISNLKDA